MELEVEVVVEVEVEVHGLLPCTFACLLKLLITEKLRPQPSIAHLKGFLKW